MSDNDDVGSPSGWRDKDESLFRGGEEGEVGRDDMTEFISDVRTGPPKMADFTPVTQSREWEGDSRSVSIVVARRYAPVEGGREGRREARTR